jgi:hypothetical protein
MSTKQTEQKRGRPAKPESEKQRRNVMLRLTDSEYAILEARAREARLGLGTLVRSKIDFLLEQSV